MNALNTFIARWAARSGAAALIFRIPTDWALMAISNLQLLALS